MSSIDSLQKAALRDGDFRLTPNARQRWGAVRQMTTGGGSPGLHGVQAGTFVDTPPWTENRRWKLELRVFDPANGIWQPFVPFSQPARLQITVRRAVDRDKGYVVETFNLAEGEMFAKVVTALQLNVTAALFESTGGAASFPVEICCVPVTCCEDNDVPADVLAGYVTTLTTRWPSTILAATPALMAARPLRAQLYVQNVSASRLFLHFGNGVETAPGTEFATVVLDPSEAYESPVGNCFKGLVTFCWDVADASGYGLTTEGVY